MIKIRAEINLRNRKTVEKRNESKRLFLEKINNINNL
jgi:hypothetical protein